MSPNMKTGGKGLAILWAISLVAAFTFGRATLPPRTQERNLPATDHLQENSSTESTYSVVRPERQRKIPKETVDSLEELLSLPYSLLVQAFEKKKELLESEAVDREFKRTESITERDERKRSDFARLSASFNTSAYWISSTSVVLGGVSRPIRLFLKFYDSQTKASAKIDENEDLSESLTIHLGVSFSSRSYRTWEGMDPHLEHLRQKDGKIIILSYVDDFEAKQHFAYIAATLPSDGNREGHVYLLDSKSLNWNEVISIQWLAVSQEDFEKELVLLTIFAKN